MTRTSLCSAATLLLIAQTTLATPYDKCGIFINGLEGCVVFQPDDEGPNVQPDFAPPPAGTRGRLTGNLATCTSFCFLQCIVGAEFLNCSVPCFADFDHSGDLSVNDIFVYLNAWLAGNLTADTDNSGDVGVNDIFLFINQWFAGC